MLNTPASKLGLLIRTRELDAFRGLLDHLDNLPPNERYAWLDANVETLAKAYATFVDYSNRTLDMVGTDQESMKLSSKLISGLKETGDLVQKILNQDHQLRS